MIRLVFQRIHWKLNDTVGFSVNSLEIERHGWFFNEFIGNSTHRFNLQAKSCCYCNKIIFERPP